MNVERGVGRGWISGALSVFLGACALGGVICFHFPALFTVPELRDRYPVIYLRALLDTFILVAFLLGVVSIVLTTIHGASRYLAWIGIALASAALALGGGSVPIEGPLDSRVYFGLDWFLLNLLFFTLIFVPLEKAFQRKPQSVLRKGWKTDLAYFFANHVLIQGITFVVLFPATKLFTNALLPELAAAVQSQPLLLQFVEVVAIADFSNYLVHRSFHEVPALWRFHRIHHSVETLDWIAGSRLHIVDTLLMRALTFIPLYIVGFSQNAVAAYLVFVSFHAVFIHANVRFKFPRWLQRSVVTPIYHHWHHSSAAVAINKNYALHLPIYDKLFKTIHAPNQWPDAYGIAHESIGEGYFRQFLEPFRK